MKWIKFTYECDKDGILTKMTGKYPKKGERILVSDEKFVCFTKVESLAELAAEMRISEDYTRGYEAGVAAENERIQELIRGLHT